MTYEETMTSEFFERWFEEFLIPQLKEKSVIILDNARFHRMNKLEKIAEKYCHKILPLPPYSPELNPIEKCWANLKNFVRDYIRKFDSLEETIVAYFDMN